MTHQRANLIVVIVMTATSYGYIMQPSLAVIMRTVERRIVYL